MKIIKLVEIGLIPADHWLTKAIVSDEHVSIIDGDVVWHSGRWLSGTWYGGKWESGVWISGVWISGMWESGTWCNGKWESGVWVSGTWCAGAWKDGKWKTGNWLCKINKCPDSHASEHTNAITLTNITTEYLITDSGTALSKQEIIDFLKTKFTVYKKL